MLEKMRMYVNKNGRLEYSQKRMLKCLFQTWGGVLIKRTSRDYLNPEILAIRQGL